MICGTNQLGKALRATHGANAVRVAQLRPDGWSVVTITADNVDAAQVLADVEQAGWTIGRVALGDGLGWFGARPPWRDQ